MESASVRSVRSRGLGWCYACGSGCWSGWTLALAHTLGRSHTRTQFANHAAQSLSQPQGKAAPAGVNNAAAHAGKHLGSWDCLAGDGALRAAHINWADATLGLAGTDSHWYGRRRW